MAEITVKVTTTEYGVSFYAEASPISYDEYGQNVKISIGIMSSEGSGITTSGKSYYIGNDTYAGENTYNGLKKGTKYSYFVRAFIRSPYVVFAEKHGEFTPWRETKHLVGKQAYSLDYDNAKSSYTKVRIVIDDKADPYEYGTDVGRTLEIKNPWVAYPPENGEARDRTIHAYADDVAQDILTRVNGYSYQPFDARGAFLSDDAELGDAVWFDGVYGAIVSQDITFDGLGNSDVSAPNGEDNENEFGEYVPSAESDISERLSKLTTEFIVQNGYIKSAIFTSDEWSQFEQTHNSLSTVVGNKITNAKTEIKQDINSITLSVTAQTDADGNYTGDTTMQLTGAGINITARNLEFAVDHTRIAGKLTADQIEAITVKAHDLYGQTVTLYASDETTSVGTLSLTDTQTGDGVKLSSEAGLKLVAGTQGFPYYGNIYLEGGEARGIVPAKFRMESGAINLSANALVLESQGVGQTLYNYFYDADSPSTHISNPVTGQLYFQLVT